MSLKLCMKEDGYLVIKFKEGDLHVPGEYGSRPDAKLFYGSDGSIFAGEQGNMGRHPYSVPLECLQKVPRIPLLKVEIWPKTYVSKTLFGGLKVERKDETGIGIKPCSSFSRREYKIIQKYLKSLYEEPIQKLKPMNRN